MVTHQDAVAFCEWLSEREQLPYRLPTEAEWEYCCRAGGIGTYPFPRVSMDDYVWSLNNAGRSLTPRPVATRQPNAWNLFDMAGNVREWCLDWYSDSAYQNDVEEFPNGPESGTLRVIRGGCFIDVDAFFRASHRGSLQPEQVLGNQGFRVVKSERLPHGSQAVPETSGQETPQPAQTK
jgi:formylglycine-generating enzyme required for sulfatase activity